MSLQVASALREWLPYVIQSIRPFLSDRDISKGDTWIGALAQELKEAEYAIICVTPYNIEKPWMNFEACALSKLIDQPNITPFLFDVDRSDVKGPLAQFQSTVYDQHDIRNLMYSINNKLGTAKLDHDLLGRTFDAWWGKLKESLEAVKSIHQEETRTAYKWLYTLSDFKSHLENVDYASVWFITSELAKYPPPRKKNVTDNKTLHVTYFVPHPIIEEEKQQEALASVKAAGGEIHFIPDVKFHDNAVTDYVIINPIGDSSQPRRMFLRLPIDASDGEFWIKVDEPSVGMFKSRFEKLREDKEINT